jgi:hypothetical protein
VVSPAWGATQGGLEAFYTHTFLSSSFEVFPHRTWGVEKQCTHQYTSETTASQEFDNTALPLHMLSPALFSTQLLAAFQFFSLSTVRLLALYRLVLLTPRLTHAPTVKSKISC